MQLSNYSSLIELLTAFYFGTVGFGFFGKYYAPLKSSIDRNSQIFNEFYGSINESQTTALASSPADLMKYEKRGLYYAYSKRFELFFYKRFYEIFVKAGIFCVFLLVVIGTEGRCCFANYAGLMATSLFFIGHIIYRCWVFNTRIKLTNIFYHIIHKNLHDRIYILGESLNLIKKIFCIKCVFDDFTAELKNRGIFFISILLIIFHFTKYLLSFSGITFAIGTNFVVILVLVTMFSPYIVFAIYDFCILRRLKLLRAEVRKEGSKQNEDEMSILLSQIDLNKN
jgi:hypothetical protein